MSATPGTSAVRPFLRGALFLLLVPAAIVVRGQEGPCDLTLRGRVIDDHDRGPLSRAEILLPEVPGKGTTSDEEGRYVLTGLCPGIHLVRVMHLGCEPVEKRVRIMKDTRMDFHLEHHIEELAPFEIAVQRPDEDVGMARGVMGKEEMELASGRSLAEMLAAMPGVGLLPSGPTIAKPMIHGLSGNRILTLNQGVRQEDQQWGTEHAPNLDPFSSDRVTVVKGAASVQYGADAIGGVVVTEPVELPREAGIGGEVRAIGILNGRGGGASGMLEGGVKGVRGLGWRVQGSARGLGDSEAPGYVLSNTGLRESGLSAAMGMHRYRWGAQVYYSWFGRELGILRAAHIGNLTDLRNAIERGEPWYQAPFTYGIGPPRQEVAHHLLKTEARFRLSDRDQLVLTYAYQADDRQEYDIRRGGRSARPALDLFLTTHTADAVLKHWIGPKLHGKVGVNGLVQDNYNVAGTGVRPLLPDHTKETGGIFVLEHYPLGDKLELEAGARLEGTVLRVGRWDRGNVYVTPEHRFTNHAFSVGANWDIREELGLRFNLSSAFRPPHVVELYSEGLHHGSAAIEIGDPGLPSERVLKAVADLDGTWFGGKLKGQFTLHAARFQDYIYLRPAGYELTIRGAFPVFAHVATDVDMHGLDAGLEFLMAPRWVLRSRSSIVRGRDRTLGEWLFQMPADRTENALLYRRAKWGGWRAVEAGIVSTCVAEQTRIPEGLDFTGPPPAYHLLGFTVAMSRPLARNELRIGLSGGNLLNTAYRDYLDRFRYFTDARGMDLTVWVRYAFGAGR